MSVQFDWQDPDKLLAAVTAMLEQRHGRIQRIPEMAIRRATFELQALIKSRAPKKTSTLVRSINADVKRLGADLVEGRVGTWLRYARWLDEGTGIYGPKGQPIQIVAKNRRALFWGAYDGHGGRIIRRRVVVKGIKPRRYFSGSIFDFLPRYAEIISEEIGKASQ